MFHGELSLEGSHCVAWSLTCYLAFSSLFRTIIHWDIFGRKGLGFYIKFRTVIFFVNYLLLLMFMVFVTDVQAIVFLAEHFCHIK